MLTEWITAIATSVTALTVVIAVWQIRADHERSRRELAVQLLLEWAKSLNPRGSIARKFATTLSRDQAVALLKQVPFSYDVGHLDLLVGALPPGTSIPEAVGGLVPLGTVEVAQLRWEVLAYLNKLEAVLTSWRHWVADREMLEEEFSFLVSPDNGSRLVPEVLDAAGGDYPAIREFAEHIARFKKSSKSRVA